MDYLLALLVVASATPTPAPSGGGGAIDPFALAFKEFAGYGVVGIVAIILGIVAYRGWKVDQARWAEALERERQRADRAEAANTDLNRETRERIVPLLTEVNRVTTEVLTVLRDRDRR